ncbi:MAG: c-type cytochrome, partial [Bryobacterales bacterium]|nr:c-type cytochrome [Bryobacterales bacterium]
MTWGRMPSCAPVANRRWPGESGTRPKLATCATMLFSLASAFGQQSSLAPGGTHASQIKSLGVFFFWLLGIIFLIVIAIAVASIFQRGQSTQDEAAQRRLKTAIAGASVLTILILFGLVVVSVGVGKEISAPGGRGNELVVEVTGNQWWWFVRYLNDDPTRIVVTANELHIPVGRPVLIRGLSNDVIHSFWVPGLQGKRDLIPSRVTTQWIETNEPGRYRGQCAEFCGLQHAHMALWTVAEPESQFQQWIGTQLRPGAAPSDDLQQRGQEVFLSHACVLCHSIQGTTANGQVGPDLTHFGSRLSIAAGTLPNNKGNLAGWIADPQNIKPGTRMATVPLDPTDMQPLL